jgi:hypothetical protein
MTLQLGFVTALLPRTEFFIYEGEKNVKLSNEEADIRIDAILG